MSILIKSPSNIALIKYWGKKNRQKPQNASISFSLSQSVTTLELDFVAKNNNQQIDLDFKFDNQQNDKFANKISNFLASIADELPFLYDYKLFINSSNSFPHSAGIASSASSMSALACALVAMAEKIGFEAYRYTNQLQNCSYLARLGSGSACRSVYPKAAIWGKTKHWSASSDDYAVPFADSLHHVFDTFCDTILLVSKKEKSVSSTVGHYLMENNPFAAARYQQADDNMQQILAALRSGELEKVGEIMEEEALTLHALMMMSRPAFILLAPNSLKVIELIRNFRKETHLPLYFSIDAGPNIHLLYPKSIFLQVQQFIQTVLIQYCENNQFINDYVG
jgi:diphosphomevalonate decarboxylase